MRHLNSNFRPDIQEPPRWPMTLAVMGHILFIIGVVLIGKYAPQKDPLDSLPAAVELWEGGRPPQPVTVLEPKQVKSRSKKTPAIKTPKLAQADVYTEPIKENKREREKPSKPERTKPEVATKPQTEPTKPKQAEQPKPPARQQTKEMEMDDLLGNIDGPSKRGSGNADRSQQGGKTGSPDGVQGGRGKIDMGKYTREVEVRVRASTRKPESSTSTPTVGVRVRLDPTMRVQSVTITRSSGDQEYDAAVKAGVQNVGVFPPPPEGANPAEFRSIPLNIRLKN